MAPRESTSSSMMMEVISVKGQLIQFVDTSYFVKYDEMHCWKKNIFIIHGHWSQVKLKENICCCS